MYTQIYVSFINMLNVSIIIVPWVTIYKVCHHYHVHFSELGRIRFAELVAFSAPQTSRMDFLSRFLPKPQVQLRQALQSTDISIFFALITSINRI